MMNLVLFCLVASCASETAAPTKNIVELAQSVPDLSTLVTAVVAGNLNGPLSGTGPFTVFAPTNEAFAKVPAATLAHLLDPKNIKELAAVLEYHVIVGAAVFAKDLKPEQMVQTLEGDSLDITASATAGVQINGVAKVTAADNAATNGVVHIIDAVLIPPAPPAPSPAPAAKNIVELAQSVPDLSTLVTALVAGKLTAALSGTGPFTVFAPTNEAFAKVPAATLTHLLDPKNIKELQAVLEYHVIAGAAVFAKDLKPEQMVTSLEGQVLNISASARFGVQINGVAMVTAADNAATNGVVHIIDAVLIPPTPPTPSPNRCAGKKNYACSGDPSDMAFCLAGLELWCGAGTHCNPQGWKDFSPCIV